VAAGRELSAFGIKNLAGQLPGTAVQFLVPVIVVSMLGLDEAGFYRAAASISVGYLGFLIRAMALDYYPRLAAATSNPASINDLVRQQQRVVLLVGVPIIFAVAAGASIVVPLLYTQEFGPTIDLLRWQLIGEIPRFMAWTLILVLVAQGEMGRFFWLELAAASIFLTLVIPALATFGLAGVGMAYAANAVAAYLLIRFVVGRKVAIDLNRTDQLLALAVVLYLGTLAIVDERHIGPVTLFAVAVAAVAAAISARFVWREFRGGPSIEAAAVEPPAGAPLI
jgi:PST family polysaccharide transporter